MHPRSEKVGVTVVHPGTQYAPRLVEQLHRRGLLREFRTGIAFSDSGCLRPLLKPGARNAVARYVSRRVARGVPARQICLHPIAEAIAGIRLRRGGDLQQVLYQRDRFIQHRLPEHVFARSQAVVGFDTAAWIVAQRCVAAGIPFLLDQSIGHPGAKVNIYEKVRREFPAWADDLDYRRPEVLQAENTEHRLASRIVAASSFTRRTLVENGVSAKKIVVNPYGVDIGQFTPVGVRPPRPLRFVFVGQVGARKGIPLLLDVWRELAAVDAELWLIGHVAPRCASLISGRRGVVVKGAVSHRELPALLRQCDVFVFPSYFEGFGLVLLEAMACGLPAIGTDATAAPDVLTDGEEGFVITAGDRAALYSRMAWFLEDPTRCIHLGGAAARTARRFSWDSYGDRWAALVRDVAENGGRKVA